MAHTHTQTTTNAQNQNTRKNKSLFIWFTSCKIKVIHWCTKVNTEQTPFFFVFKEKKHFLNFSNVELDKREGGPETANLDGSDEAFSKNNQEALNLFLLSLCYFMM